VDTPTDSTNSLDIATQRLMDSAVLGDDGTLNTSEVADPVLDDAEVEEPEQDIEADVDDDQTAEVEVDDTEEVEETASEDDEDTQASYESLQDFAEALDVPMEELLTTVKAKIKVDGVEDEITLDSLIRDHQKSRHFLTKANQLAEERRRFDAEVQERMQQFETSNAESAYILNTLTLNVQKKMQSPQMQQLRNSNVAEWNAQRIQLEENLKGIEKLRENAAAKYEATKAKIAQDKQTRLAEQLVQEAERLEEVIPNWSEDTRKEITNFLMQEPDYAFQPEIVNAINDHRYVRMAWEAMQYRKQLKDADKTVKAVKKAPKALKPGKRPSPKAKQNKQVQQLRGRLRKTGSMKDAAALFEKIL